MKPLLSAAVFLASAAGTLVAYAQPAQRADMIDGAEAMQTMHLTATVEAVDVQNRMVTLKGASGELHTLPVSEEVRNLPQVQVGDKVSIDYYEAVALEVKKTAAEPSAAEDISTERAKPGERPAGTALRKVRIVTDVLGVNIESQSILIRGPLGNLTRVKVRDASLLPQLQTGGRIELTYLEGLAVEVRPGTVK